MLVEVPEARPLLVLCGGGHVGGAVLKLAAFLGFETILIDDRDETVMGEKIALAGRFIRVKDYRKDLRTLEIPERAYVVLATHSHSTDAVALEAMLDKNTAYLGMLASPPENPGRFCGDGALGHSEGAPAAGSYTHRFGFGWGDAGGSGFFHSCRDSLRSLWAARRSDFAGDGRLNW